MPQAIRWEPARGQFRSNTDAVLHMLDSRGLKGLTIRLRGVPEVPGHKQARILQSDWVPFAASPNTVEAEISAYFGSLL